MSMIEIADAGSFDFAAASDRMGALALFTAPWCAPGERLAETLARLAPELPVPVLKVDADRAPTLPRRFGVNGLPSLVLVRDGQVAGTRFGELSDDDLRRWIDAVLASA
jgi:thioredoxin 2